MSPYKKLERNPGRHHRPSGHHGYKAEAPTPQESIQPDFLAGTKPIDPDEERAMEDSAYKGAAQDIADREGLNAEQLQAAEQEGGSNVASDAENQESKSPGLFNEEDDGKTKKKGRLSVRKKSIAGIVTTFVVGGGLGIFSILQGPGQIIHFGQLLQKFHFTNNEEFKDSRTGKFFMYLATSDNPNRRNLGIVGNRPANRYERLLREAGIEMNFDHPIKNGKQVRRIQSMTIDTSAPKGKATLENMRRQGITPEDLGGGKFNVNLRGKGGTELSRKAIKASVESIDLTQVGESMAKRLLIHRARVDFHPLRNRVYEEGQDRRNFHREVQEEDADRDKHGAEKPDGRVGGVQEDSDGDGTVDNDTTGSAGEGEAEIEAAKDVDSPGKLSELKTRYAKLVKGTGLVGAGVAIVCAIKGLSDQAEDIEHANIILPLIRIGMRIVTTANQVMAGQGFNIDELGAVIDTLHSEEFGSWAEARSIQKENGQKPKGPDINDEAKPSKVGEKAEIFQILDSGPVDTVCGVNNAVGNLPVIKQIGDISDAAIDAALKPFGWSMNRLMSNAASLLAAEQIALPAFGATLGNFANYGARLAANDTAIGSGGRALSGTEVVELDNFNQNLLNEEFSRRGVFARYFDLNEPRSLAAKTLYENSALYKPRATFASLLSAPSRIFSPLSSVVQPRVSAQEETEEPYDYGFPEYGFSLGEQNDERFEDPMENADIIEPRLQQLNERYNKCFSMSVKPEDGALVTGQAARYDEIADNENCSNVGETFADGSNELTRYRFYVADMVNTHSLACYEGSEDSCNQLGFGSVVDTGSGTITTPGSGKIEGDPYTDSSGVNCAEGTEDLGLNEGYREGQKFTVRLCSVSNLPSTSMADNPGNTYSTPGANGFAVVNSRVSGAWYALVRDAKAAGISNVTVTSSFRSMQHQTDLFNSNPDPEYVARPGYSSHQAGVALDFASMHTTGGQDCGAGRARSPDDPLWNWLYQNADRYGFKQYSAEAWHWDALPAANRCSGGG